MENDETMIPDKDVSVFKTPKGINEDIVREISAIKGEPEWMLEYRLKALDCFLKKPMPTWGVDLSRVDFDEYTYYIRPSDKQTNKWEEVPETIKDTFNKLGIPEAEQKYLSGVTTQYESEVVYHNMLKEVQEKGVIFLDILFIDHFENIVQNLRSTYEMIEFEGLEKLVDLIYQSNEICFAGNFFTQSVSMQLQIELSYLGKKCTGMYPLQSQKEVVRNLKENDLIIVSSIAGGYWQDHPDMLREIAKSKAHKICVTQVENMPYQDQFDMIIQVGTDHLSLIGKFPITYIFELLEALYHIKYGRV